jgi:hypothetical protein
MRRWLVLLFCLTPWLAQAAGPNEALQPGQVLRGRFVQERHLQGFTAPLKTEGHFLLAPGKGLIWRAETPFAVTTVISAAGLVQEVNGTQTMRLPASRLPFLARLYDMLGGALAGDWRGLEGDFVVTRSGGDQAWTVALTPRKAADAMTMPFAAITARGGRFVDGVKMAKPDGDSDDLAFLDQTLSAAPLTGDEAAALESAGK